MTHVHVACESKLFSVVGHPLTNEQETGWQSGMRSCIMLGLPTHLVQELNVGTVDWSGLLYSVHVHCLHFWPDHSSANVYLVLFTSTSLALDLFSSAYYKINVRG